MLPRAFYELVGRGLKRLPLAVGPVRGDRVDGVCDREYAGAEADVIALDLVGVAAPVITFVVLRDDHRRAA